MGRAKDIIVKPIHSKDARRICKQLHYSGKVPNNVQIHLGVFLDGKCGGVLQFGPAMDKSKVLPLVRGTKWGEMLELNRMALADWLPRNGESRTLAVSMRILRKAYPHMKWVLSYSDATQCGDGTIYRAAGFVLTGIKESRGLYRMPDGTVVHEVALGATAGKPRPELGGRSMVEVNGGSFGVSKYVEMVGATRLEGFQLRYMYFLKPEERANLTVPEVPFSAIDEAGAGMYLGKKRTRVGSIDSDAPATPGGRGQCKSDPDAPPC